jgi:hypothetical protein
MFQGQHDGYERLKPAVTHRRTIAQHRDAIVVVDELFGSGIVDAKSRVHLHPSVSFDDVQIIPFGATETTRERGWYSERFGEKKENDVLVLGARGAMPYVFGYCVALRGGVAAAMERDGTLRLRAGGRDFTLRLARDAEPHIE